MFDCYYQNTSSQATPAQLRRFKLRQPDLREQTIRTSSIYLARWRSRPGQQEQQRLVQLLGAQSGSSELQHQLIVLPRIGMQTAWSAKVLDICTLCQLDLVAVEQGLIWSFAEQEQRESLRALCYDAMTEQCFDTLPTIGYFFTRPKPKSLYTLKNLHQLDIYNREKGLGLRTGDMDYLRSVYHQLGRQPNDAELMMFAQVNSEHCRHRIFNGSWWIDGKQRDSSLFDAIRATSRKSPVGILSAYSDNAAVIEGWQCQHLQQNQHGTYGYSNDQVHHCIKVETHNHPTAIAPYEGAATGTGGEIRDEGATGIGAMPKAGMHGFIVSDLHVPSFIQPWERKTASPHHADALEIMVSAPLGSSNYGNEFGRPTICGVFRTVDVEHQQKRFANVKPIMLAGGLGSITAGNIQKKAVSDKYPLLVLGGPSMRIGIGGGSTSSVIAGSSQREIDFSSVQRDNPEMERRCQQVLDRCTSLTVNPIVFIHDIGAGGLANAFPELVHESQLGARIDLDKVPSVDPSLSPMEVWCNESQERYALAIHPCALGEFIEICQRERCPYAVIGETTEAQQLIVTSGDTTIVDMPMKALFGDLPGMIVACTDTVSEQVPIHCMKPRQSWSIDDTLERILCFPAVASKEFLITIADRSITGLVAGEPMIGEWQVPVADCALTLTGYAGSEGEAIAVAERTPLAIIDVSASVRIALGELITNIVSCGDARLDRIKLSANWMAASHHNDQKLALFQGVNVLSELCQQLGIAVPVGKDSLSMESSWQDQQGKQHQAISPMSVILTGYCRVQDVGRRLTPQLSRDGDSCLYFIDLAQGCQRLGGSAFSQIHGTIGAVTPDLVSAQVLMNFVDVIDKANRQNLLLAYHDRSDGGLWSCLCEMAFAGHTGLDLDISTLGSDPLAALVNEELGAVVQIRTEDCCVFEDLAGSLDIYQIGQVIHQNQMTITYQSCTLYTGTISTLESTWSNLSRHIEHIRDSQTTSAQAQNNIRNWHRSKLTDKPSFSETQLYTPGLALTKPRLAILREQGTNGHREMAAAFLEADCEPVDVHMTDLIEGRYSLDAFQGLIACGGFSYGDVLGAGTGWASVILHNQQLRDSFAAFFDRDSTFSLGVCNGCQMLAQLSSIIPDAPDFPQFVSNDSGRFEGRLVNLTVESSPSVLLDEMQGSILVTAVAHGYGKVEHATLSTSVCLRYCNDQGQETHHYPDNPNGSLRAIAGLSSKDGRVTIMMPHPERNFLRYQSGWQKAQASLFAGRYSPWFKLFTNARKFCQ